MREAGYQVAKSPWWAALVRRYALRPGSSSNSDNVRMASLISPVVDVDRLLDQARQPTGAPAVVADGNLLIMTVPTGKRWQVGAYWVTANAGGVYNRQVRFFNPSGNAIPFEAAAAATAETYRSFGVPVIMDSGWAVYLAITGFAAGGAFLGMAMLVLEQDQMDNRTAFLPT